MEQRDRYWKVTAEGVQAVYIKPSVLKQSYEWLISHWYDGGHVFENKSRADLFYYTRYILKNYNL